MYLPVILYLLAINRWNEAGAAPVGRGRAVHPGHSPARGDADCAHGATASPEGREETRVFCLWHMQHLLSFICIF